MKFVYDKKFWIIFFLVISVIVALGLSLGAYFTKCDTFATSTSDASDVSAKWAAEAPPGLIPQSCRGHGSGGKGGSDGESYIMSNRLDDAGGVYYLAYSTASNNTRCKWLRKDDPQYTDTANTKWRFNWKFSLTTLGGGDNEYHIQTHTGEYLYSVNGVLHIHRGPDMQEGEVFRLTAATVGVGADCEFLINPINYSKDKYLCNSTFGGDATIHQPKYCAGQDDGSTIQTIVAADPAPAPANYNTCYAHCYNDDTPTENLPQCVQTCKNTWHGTPGASSKSTMHKMDGRGAGNCTLSACKKNPSKECGTQIGVTCEYDEGDCKTTSTGCMGDDMCCGGPDGVIADCYGLTDCSKLPQPVHKP